MATELIISAAASLTDVFNRIGDAFARSEKGQTTARFNFAASGVLEKQIIAGAPVDIFASAAPKEMDDLQKAGRIVVPTRIDFAHNRLVLIVPASGHPGEPVKDWKDLARPGVQHIAVSNPDSVPAGRYARETLTKRGLWVTLQPKMVFGENVRQTLAYVAGGNVDAGIVFATDARIEAKRVRIVAASLDGRDHDPIVYPAALVTGAPNPDAARRFLRFLQSREARVLLQQFGFS